MSKQKQESPGREITKNKEDLEAIKVVNPELADVLERINPKERAAIINVFETAIKQESFSGPIPHPDLLQGYENIQAGFAERVFRMAEKEQEHRFACDKQQIECDQQVIANTASESKRG